MLRQGVTGLRRREPLWLLVRPDEVEIGIGGVRFSLAGGRLFHLELIEDSVAMEFVHVVPQFLARPIPIAVLR